MPVFRFGYDDGVLSHRRGRRRVGFRAGQLVEFGGDGRSLGIELGESLAQAFNPALRRITFSFHFKRLQLVPPDGKPRCLSLTAT
ncbi:hypothetical protein AYO41_04785 [Verrucomicrobia bacterium SCGC AG-212-E04]|nr:hypothetical protein AYO41_04785 [Verrucomicrobia bacterium SCGC AG-212-E04]